MEKLEARRKEGKAKTSKKRSDRSLNPPQNLGINKKRKSPRLLFVKNSLQALTKARSMYLYIYPLFCKHTTDRRTEILCTAFQTMSTKKFSVYTAVVCMMKNTDCFLSDDWHGSIYKYWVGRFCTTFATLLVGNLPFLILPVASI